METQIIAAWITASVAIVSLATTTIVQIVFRYRESRAARKQEILRHRREALHSALQVIDHVYANTEFNERPAARPHTWDLSLAWDVMNKMIIYCENPNEAIGAFVKATGLHNPDTQKPDIFGPKHLEKFRSIVCRELEIPELKYSNPDVAWIAKLPGAE